MSTRDPGWYDHPAGTIAWKIEFPPDFGDLE